MAAPKLNKFALGNHGGRPSHYNSVKELYKKADEYFAMETTTTGICKPTISGLMFHLGFSTRKSFYDYKEKGTDINGESWKDAVLLIEQFIESCYEKNLHGYNWAGSAFALKNLAREHWKDEVTQHQIVSNVEASFNKAVQPSHESGEDSQGDK